MQLIIEPQFSVERRSVSGLIIDLQPQPDYTIVYFPASTCLLVNPYQPIQFSQKRRKSEFILIRLKPELLVETATRLGLYRTGSNLLFRKPLNPLTDDARLLETTGSIAREMDGVDAGWRDMVRSLVSQLAVYLLRKHINVQKSEVFELSRAGIVDRRLRRAIEFMHDNCSRDLPLTEIAEAAYLSEFHFARIFKKITGVTPHGYLASLRIEKARRLLAETDIPIIEISAMVGYSGQSHFTKVFRGATGLTPRAFRESARGKREYETHENNETQKKI